MFLIKGFNRAQIRVSIKLSLPQFFQLTDDAIQGNMLVHNPVLSTTIHTLQGLSNALYSPLKAINKSLLVTSTDHYSSSQLFTRGSRQLNTRTAVS